MPATTDDNPVSLLSRPLWPTEVCEHALGCGVAESASNLLIYLVFTLMQVSHTEPDHSFLVPAVLDEYPDATVVASKVALNFLAGLTNR